METSGVIIKGKNADDVGHKKANWISWIVFLLSLILIFFMVRFVIGFIAISGNSMNPTLDDGDLLLTSNIFYSVDRNDIVVFRDDNGFDVIKRVIGIPNDRIAIQDGIVYVNGKELEESYTIGLSIDMEEIVVPNESYFVIGDNRTPGESLDSRSERIGSIDKRDILGEVMISIYPFSFNK